MPAKAQFEAVALALTAYTCWVFADTTLKLVGSSRLPPFEVIAWIGVATSCLMLLQATWRRQLKHLWPRNPRHQVVRSCLELANNVCVVIALRHLPLALFYILIFSAPMFITLLAAVFLHEPLGWKKALAVLAGFAGVVIAVDPWSMTHPGEWVGYAACAVCVASFSTNMVWSRVMTQTESGESLTFCSGMVMIVGGAVGMLAGAAPLPLRTAGVLTGTALCGLIGSLCFFRALRQARASVVSQYHYSQLVTGAVMGWLIWRDRITPPMLVGAALIAAAGWFTAVQRPEPEPGLAAAMTRI
jgi:drug/metabolite transporter (DMT)-like permease